MKVLILIDAKNFERGIFDFCAKKNEFRFIDFHKISLFILDYLQHNSQYINNNLTHLRTYFYTGEYTDNIIRKIGKYIGKKPENPDKLNDLLIKCKKEQQKQNNFFNFAKNYYFFEIKSKPLQFSYSDIKVLQKGVDVQLAVDLVDFTQKNIYDIVVILSGDVDLLESIKIAKSMGKHVVIFGDASVTAEEMKKYSDIFVDIGRFSDEQLNKFTHRPNEVKK